MRKLNKLNIKTVEHLCLFLGCSRKELRCVCDNPESFYEHFSIITNGKKRPIDKPVGFLLIIQKKLAKLLNRVELPSYLHGGIKERSPLTNAKYHIGKAFVLNFDIADFFPSIRPCQVYNAFISLGCSPDVSHHLTKVTMCSGGLPQGANTSTAVANLVILPLARRLNGLAMKHKSTYTQFVDDGTMSGPLYLAKLKPLIEKIIRQEGFCSKPEKFKVYPHSGEQVVTGIKVNNSIDIPTQKSNQILQEIKYVDHKASKSQILSVKGKITYANNLNPKNKDIFDQKFSLAIHEARRTVIQG